VLDKPDYRSRALSIADEFATIDTRSEILRIIDQVVRDSAEGPRRGEVAAISKDRTTRSQALVFPCNHSIS
jgi:hypothetical protein